MIDYKNLTQNKTWVITKDHGVVEDCENATSEQVKQIIEDGFTEKFELYDDDEELYYSGYAKQTNDTDGFEPLDDFGMPNAGCTIIKYYNPKTFEFETL